MVLHSQPIESEVPTVTRIVAAGCPSTVRGPSIARAAADHSRRRSAWLTGRRLETARRRPLLAVDALVETVEEINLSGRGRQHDPLIPHRLRRLEAEIGRSAPERVHRARNGHQLHAALMDWQEELLDEACPAREFHGAVDEALMGELMDWARAEHSA
jgi:hypothetical protein